MICILTVKFITRKEKFPVNMFTACLNIFMLAMINKYITDEQTNKQSVDAFNHSFNFP